jgi:hypothetical protein
MELGGKPKKTRNLKKTKTRQEGVGEGEEKDSIF